jgi:hypothetical protein
LWGIVERFMTTGKLGPGPENRPISHCRGMADRQLEECSYRKKCLRYNLYVASSYHNFAAWRLCFTHGSKRFFLLKEVSNKKSKRQRKRVINQ